VLSSNLTDVEVTLQIGTATETVTVEAANVQVQTSVSELTSFVQGFWMKDKSGPPLPLTSTSPGPRSSPPVFPETLLWQPEIHTDRAGHSTVKVPLADSITTWKVSVIASTLDGHIATGSTDIRAFLPFFAELEPPKSSPLATKSICR